MRIADFTGSTVTKFTRTLLALLIALAATAGVAQEGQRRQGPPPGQRQTQQTGPAAPGERVLRLLPADSVPEHSIDLPSGRLAYTATAGTLSLIDQSGERA